MTTAGYIGPIGGGGGGGGGGSGTVTSVTAGAGMTQSGVSTVNPTLNVIANADASIVVNANDIQVGVLASDAQHGARGGGTQHAAVVAGGASGFITGASQTKLDGIEALADVTDATNVQAAISGAQSGARAALTPASANEVLYYGSGGVIDGSPNLIIDPATGDACFTAQTTSPATLANALKAYSLRPSADFPQRLALIGALESMVLLPTEETHEITRMWPISGFTAGIQGFVNDSGGATLTHSTPTDASDYAARYVMIYPTSGSSGASVRYKSTATYSGTRGYDITFYEISWPVLVATPRGFYGMNTAVIANVEPDTLVNIVGVGHRVADTNLFVMHNDGAGTATTVNLGANFPISATARYKIRIFKAPAVAAYYVYVQRLDAAFSALTSITTEMPADSTMVGFNAWANNGTTASTQHLACGGINLFKRKAIA